MSLPGVDVDQLSARLLLIRAHLDERAWRLLLGAEAKVLGRGGIKVVAGAVKAHPDTVAQGVRELDYPDRIPGRVRRPGGGRRAAAVTDPTLWEALDALVDPVTRGDPVSAPAVDDEIDGETVR
jgi:hypothetical protein